MPPLYQVMNDQICYKYTEYRELYQLFADRARLHQTVYSHPKAKAIELMVVDALEIAEPVLQITAGLSDPQVFSPHTLVYT